MNLLIQFYLILIGDFLIYCDISLLYQLFGGPMNRFNMRNYQSMNMITKSDQGNELWLGDYGAATDINLLKKKNITHVLTAAAMLNIYYPKDLGINHKVINAFDMPTYKMTPHFNQVHDFISEGLQKGNVLVHCAAGISRSTTCVIVYLMRTKGFSFKQALEFTRSKRPIINPNSGFQNELSRYQFTLKHSKMAQSNGLKGSKIFQPQKKVVEEERKAVINFIDRDKTNNRLNSTFGSKVTKLNKPVQEKVMEIRGKSQNYRTFQNGNQSKQQSPFAQFLTFKLQAPKIVTIKR